MLITINEFLLDIHQIHSDRHCQESKPDTEPYSLFPDNPDLRSHPQIEQLSVKVAALDCSPLYGRGRSFHFDDPELRKFTAATTFGLVMYADISERTLTGTAQRFLEAKMGIKYLTDPDFLARRVCEATKDLPVEFIQNFYGMSEGELLGAPLRRTMGNIATNHVIRLSPTANSSSEGGGSLKTMKVDGSGYFEVPIPSSHIGQSDVKARFLSPFRTNDMIGDCKSCFRICSCKIQPASDAIFFHMHGGGFIAQTSKSHQSYLRQWSRNLGIPILSIDYSLAPQAPFPR